MPVSIGNVQIDPSSGALSWLVTDRYVEPKATYAQSCGCIPGLRDTTPLKWLSDNKIDILAGITTGLTAVPTAVAFSILANVLPSVGLRGTWIIMLIMAIFGGRTGMIYSNSGSMGIILEPLNAERSVGYMFYAFILAGIIQVVIGCGKVAKVLRLMPVSVMIGFVNGLAIVLLLAQVKNFQKGNFFANPDAANDHGRRLATSFDVFDNGNEWVTGAELGYMFLIMISTMITVILSGRYIKHVPPILIGVVVSTLVEWAIIRGMIGTKTNTLTNVAKINGTYPIPIWFDDDFSMPPINGETFSIVIGPALSLLAVGLIESLMTVRLVNEITRTASNVDREAVMGGIGNIFAGAFGGQGGNSEIGLTMVNLRSGGRTRVAGTVSGLLVLIIVLVAYPAINLIPTSGLVGIMVVIAWKTFDWSSLPKVIASLLLMSWRKSEDCEDTRKNALASQAISRPDALIIVAVTVITPFTNLAIAVGVGIGLALLTFTWQSGYRVRAHTYYRTGVEIMDPPIIKVYDVVGPIFFASLDTFLNLFDYHNDPLLVEIHFHTASICDYSAIQAINTLGERYTSSGRTMRLRRITGESLRVITRGNRLLAEEIMIDLSEESEKAGPTEILHRTVQMEGIGSAAMMRVPSSMSNAVHRRRTIDLSDLNRC